MPPELVVPGPRWARAWTDAVAAVGVLSLLAAFWWDAVVVALFALVLLGLTVPRVARLPGAFQGFSGTCLLFGAWAATLDWYVRVPGLDMVVHALANGVLAVTLVLVMTRSGLLGPSVSRAGTVVVVTGVGALLGVVWEVGEWFGHTMINDQIQVGYDDTVGDLVAGTTGSAAAGAVLAGATTRGVGRE